MSKLTVWGHPGSSNVQKVLWGLDELGLAYERIDVGGKFGGNRDPAYLALNPNGLIPTLVDDGEALWESNAIVRYLFTKYGSAPAHPATPAGRARADAWHDWYASTFWPPVRVLLVQLIRTAERDRDLRQIEGAQTQVLAALDVLEGVLAKQPYVAGSAFTWGDIPVAVAAQRWYGLQLRRQALPAVYAWYARVRERPGFRRWVDLPLA